MPVIGQRFCARLSRIPLAPIETGAPGDGIGKWGFEMMIISKEKIRPSKNFKLF